MSVLLLHGWGFEASVWDEVLAALPPARIISADRGYFGRRVAGDDAPTLAVGHSLGALLLAASLPPHVPLVAINGFDRFAGADAVPPRLLARMRARFAVAPGDVLADFRARIGAPPAPPIADAASLADDLDRLADTVAPADGRGVLLLNGTDEPLLPPAMRDRTFRQAERETVAGAGHLLPLTHPSLCADRIARWL